MWTLRKVNYKYVAFFLDGTWFENCVQYLFLQFWQISLWIHSPVPFRRVKKQASLLGLAILLLLQGRENLGCLLGSTHKQIGFRLSSCSVLDNPQLNVKQFNKFQLPFLEPSLFFSYAKSCSNLIWYLQRTKSNMLLISNFLKMKVKAHASCT